MTNAVFTFRVARLIRKGEDNQLLCGDYMNKRDKRCSNAQFHWGQHHFLSGLFYAFQYPDGRTVTSYDRSEDMPQVDYTFNYKPKQAEELLKQIEASREEINSFPTNDEGLIESEYQSLYQLQVHVKADSYLTAEVDDGNEGERVKSRFRAGDIVAFKLVKRGDANFIYAGKGGDRMKTLDFMKAFYGEGEEASAELDTVEKIRTKYLSRAEKRASNRKQRKTTKESDIKKVNSNLTNKVLAESITLEESEDEEIVF